MNLLVSLNNEQKQVKRFGSIDRSITWRGSGLRPEGERKKEKQDRLSERDRSPQWELSCFTTTRRGFVLLWRHLRSLNAVAFVIIILNEPDFI